MRMLRTAAALRPPLRFPDQGPPAAGSMLSGFWARGGSEQLQACAADDDCVPIDGKLPRARHGESPLAIRDPDGDACQPVTAAIDVVNEAQGLIIDRESRCATGKQDGSIQHLRPACCKCVRVRRLQRHAHNGMRTPGLRRIRRADPRGACPAPGLGRNGGVE